MQNPQPPIVSSVCLNSINSKLTLLILLVLKDKSSNVFLSPEFPFEISLKLVYPTKVGQVFNFTVFKLLENAFFSQKN